MGVYLAPAPERDIEIPAKPAFDWTYDPYMRHACEGTTTSGRPCRRIARCQYHWQDPQLDAYLCGVHGRGREPRSAVTR